MRAMLLGVLLLGGCAPGPASRHVEVERAPVAAPQVQSASPPAPAPTPSAVPSASASALPTERRLTFDVRVASSRARFRLVLGDKLGEDGCAGAADLLVFEGEGETASQRVPLPGVCVVLDPRGALRVDSAEVRAEIYAEQGTFSVSDFNFDGREDIAVQVGHDGPYGGPTYLILLASSDGALVPSKALSRLTEESLGLFTVDARRKRLITSSKSGCCLHVTEEHEVRKDSPVVVHRRTEDATGQGAVEITEQSLERGSWRERRWKEPVSGD